MLSLLSRLMVGPYLSFRTTSMSAKDLKEASKDLPENWKVFHSKKSDRLYYYNTVTKKTQWHHPSLGDRNV